jgi:large subunit ribosomal protein L32
MPAVPKKKLSRRRRGNRRAHMQLKLPSLVICPQCRQYMRSHHACPHCGAYRGRQVLKVKGAESSPARS